MIRSLVAALLYIAFLGVLWAVLTNTAKNWNKSPRRTGEAAAKRPGRSASPVAPSVVELEDGTFKLTEEADSA